MKYPKAEYKKVMCCPECDFEESGSDDGMPDRDGFVRKTDKKGTEYIKCPCGCCFVE